MSLDLTDDGMVDADDLVAWIALRGTDIGDFNWDGMLDEFDYYNFLDNVRTDLSSFTLPSELYQHGDFNFDGVTDFFDLVLFRDYYDAVNGEGAFASIPEPTVGALFFGLALLGVKRRRRR